ncbi:MAG: hypothetical protein EA394_02325 [Bacteroidia bacterium]|nr:MAG: hypothetical protein EA394_02325 [Bacteroidia bacterium]
MRKEWQLRLTGFLIMAFTLSVVLQGCSERRAASGLFRVDRDHEIVKVVMENGDGVELVLYLDDHNRWMVNDGIPANMRLVRDLLSTMARMDVRRPVSLENREVVAQQLLEEGVRVEVFVASHWIRLPGDISLLPRKKSILSLMVGRDSEGGQGTFMKNIRESTPYEVHLPGVAGGISSVFIPKEHFWRSPVVLALPPGMLQSVTTSFQDNDHRSFALHLRGESDYLLTDDDGRPVAPETIDSMRLSRYARAFGHLYYQRILPESAAHPPEDLHTGDPFIEMVVTDTEGNDTFLSFYKRLPPADGTLLSERRDYDPNRFYLRVNGGDYTLAQYHVFHPIMRDLSWFYVKHPE